MKLFQAGICQVVVGSLVDVPLCLDLVIVREAIHFVNKYFKVDLRIDSVGPWHGEVKPTQSLHVVILRTKQPTAIRFSGLQKKKTIQKGWIITDLRN